jgi:hypothetical protein
MFFWQRVCHNFLYLFSHVLYVFYGYFFCAVCFFCYVYKQSWTLQFFVCVYICLYFLIKSYQGYCYVVTIGFDSMLPGHSLYSYQWVGEGWWCKLWFCIAFPFFIGYCFFQCSQIMLFLRRCQAIFDCVVTRAFVSFSFMYPNAIQVLL